MSDKTTVSFKHTQDIWPIVEGWARENGFNVIETAPTGKLYQKGMGLMVAPMMLRVSDNEGQCTLEAWVRANLFVRLMALFLVPAEMGIESGGFKMVAPRLIARKAVNKLLAQLGRPDIP
jgi:hypothetical protein